MSENTKTPTLNEQRAEAVQDLIAARNAIWAPVAFSPVAAGLTAAAWLTGNGSVYIAAFIALTVTLAVFGVVARSRKEAREALIAFAEVENVADHIRDISQANAVQRENDQVRIARDVHDIAARYGLVAA